MNLGQSHNSIKPYSLSVCGINLFLKKCYDEVIYVQIHGLSCFFDDLDLSIADVMFPIPIVIWILSLIRLSARLVIRAKFSDEISTFHNCRSHFEIGNICSASIMKQKVSSY